MNRMRRGRAHHRTVRFRGVAIIIASLGAAMMALPEMHGAQAAEECQARPNGVAPAGKHWYYLTDRAAKRRCWFLGQAGVKPPRRTTFRWQSARVPLPSPRPAEDAAVEAENSSSASSVQPVPIAKDDAAERLTAAAATGERGGREGWEARFHGDLSPAVAAAPPVPADDTGAQSAAPDSTVAQPAIRAEPASTGESHAEEPLVSSFAGEPPLVWPVLSEPEAEAELSPSPTSSAWDIGRYLAPLAGLAFILGCAFFAYAFFWRPPRAREASPHEPDSVAGYVALLSRADLDVEDERVRRATYDRARRALVTRLQAIDPPLPKATIMAELSALEAAIARIEAQRVRPLTALTRFMRRAWSRINFAGAGALLHARTG